MANYSYRQTRPHLREEILARLAAGETLQAVCAPPDMPCTQSVMAWARQDPAFGERLAQARTQGRYRRTWRFDAAKAQALLARLAAGEPITAILADPAMPSDRVYAYWRTHDAAFAEAVFAINQHRQAARVERLQARFRPFDPAVADRVVVAVSRGAALERLRRVDPAFPSYPTLRRWRAQQPDFDQGLRVALRVGRATRHARRRAAARSPQLQQAIRLRIALGDSLSSLGKAPDMPGPGLLYRWVNTDEAFAAAIEDACDARDDMIDDQILALKQATPFTTRRGARQAIAALVWKRRSMWNRPGRKWRRAAETDAEDEGEGEG